MRVSLSAVLAAFAFAISTAAPPPAVAHGATDHSVIEFHYVQIGPYTYIMPYAQHLYFCDGHYEYTPGSGGSLGLAHVETFEHGQCG